MIKDIIAKGIGFTPGSIEYIVTHGFGTGAAPSTQLYARRIRGNDPDGYDDYTISYQA